MIQQEFTFLFQVIGYCIILLLFLVVLGYLNKAVKSFFWFCSGVNIPLLKKCPNEFNRYANIGATIFFTSLLAWISMSYALNSVFQSLFPAILFGFIWALMIFVLDRTIVSSMQKPAQDTSWREFEFWRESLFALIRFFVAIIISMVIMKPLEIKIFEERLASEIKNMADEQTKLDSLGSERKFGIGTLSKEIDQARDDKQKAEENLGKEPPTETYKSLKSDLATANQQLNIIKNRNNPKIAQNNQGIANAKRIYTELVEINGKMQYRITQQGNLIIADYRSSNSPLQAEINTQSGIFNGISSAMSKERKEYQTQIQKNIDNLDTRITKKETERDTSKVKAGVQAIEDKQIREISFKGTLITQIQALGRLTANNSTLNWVSWFIMLIFIAIETAPILAKLIAKRGDYDEILDLEKHKVWVRYQYAKSKINGEINRGLEEIRIIDDKTRRIIEARENALIQMSSSKLKLQLQKELENNEELLTQISKAQKEIASIVVQQWKEDELNRLNSKAKNGQNKTKI